MLKKAATNEGKDWDKVIPYFLFAYREAPPSSTGFSPFELLYGRSVRGALDVLPDAWEEDKCEDESIISYVLTMRERFEKMSTIVQENLKSAQYLQMRWYDQNARQRQFQPGDQVLVVLPTSTNKLLAQWQGKKRRVFHINMLKRYIPTDTGYSAEDTTVDSGDDGIPVWKENDKGDSSQACIADRFNTT